MKSILKKPEVNWNHVLITQQNNGAGLGNLKTINKPSSDPPRTAEGQNGKPNIIKKTIFDTCRIRYRSITCKNSTLTFDTWTYLFRLFMVFYSNLLRCSLRTLIHEGDLDKWAFENLNQCLVGQWSVTQHIIWWAISLRKITQIFSDRNPIFWPWGLVSVQMCCGSRRTKAPRQRAN